MERSLALVVGLLGILKAGGAYIPLDSAYPTTRLALMLEDSQVPVLLIQQRLADKLPSHRARVICLDTDWFRIAQESQETLCCNVSPDHLAYMIYTSGSTGRPKGVMVTHTNLVNTYFSWEDAYHLRSPWSVHLQMASFSFDVFTGDLVRALCSGGRLVLCPGEFLLDARQLYSLMRREQVNFAEFVPVVIRYLLHYLKESRQSFDFMQVLVVGSDSWYCQEYLELSQLCGPQTQLVNSYGITEATIDSTYFDEPLAGIAIEGTVPIGRPFAHAQVYLLDKYLNPVLPGKIGDLYIGGTGLARGYQNRPELTAERFIPHPWSNVPGARLYKTGDLARYQPDGMLVHIGRRDYQVKLRGYRIELEEIEIVLLKHEEVRECLVLPWERGAGDVSLVAYVVGKKQVSSSAGELRKYLQEKVPNYMVPSFFILLEELPRTPNGKVDRDALPLPESSETKQQSIEERAKTPLEDMLAQIWCEVLRLSQASVYDNFFESGGHSLLAMQLITRARALFQVEVPLRSLFEAPTITQLARRIEQLLRGGQGLETPPLVPVTRTRELPLSFAQQRLWFLDQLEPESVQYLIPTVRRIQGALDPAALRRSLQELTARHEVLRTTFQKSEDQPVQIIHPVAVFHLPVVDLYGLRSEDRERAARSLAGQEARHPCDLAKGPLLRACLLRLAAEDHVLLLTMHHIISDAWSEAVFRRELMTLYHAFTAGHPSPLPLLPIQYADFAVWQRQWLQGEVLEKQLAYWKQQLSGIRSLELPTDYPRSPVQTFQGAIYTFGLPLTLSQAIKNLSRQTGVTLFMILLTAFQTLLYRITGQDDIAVGTVIANRTSVETEALIGFFINTLVLRTRMHGSPAFRVLLNRVREMVLGAYTHQDVPFEKLVEVLHFERVGNQIPVVQVRFAFQDGVPPTQKNTELPAQPSDFGHILAKDDLTMIMMDGTQGLWGSVTYRTDLFKASSIKLLVSHFETLLNSVVAQPDELIDRLEMYTEEEKQQFALKAKAQQEGLRNKLKRTKRQEIDLSE